MRHSTLLVWSPLILAASRRLSPVPSLPLAQYSLLRTSCTELILTGLWMLMRQERAT